MRSAPPSDSMSKMMYVKAPAPKSEEEVVVTKPLTTHHNTLMITIAIIVGSSFLIGIGFAYMGYSSGHYSNEYGLCKDDILSQVRTGMYPSVDETMAALKSCDGVTS
ncbi:MAG: hypothetical protein WAL24_12235 [Nitrososphaeraceae archaeon]